MGGFVCSRAGQDAVQKRKLSCPYRKSNPDSSAVQSHSPSLYRLSYHGYVDVRKKEIAKGKDYAMKAYGGVEV
jgi:hypothetical protein